MNLANYNVAIIGGGPAGLMAAEVLSEAGVQVNLYDAMPSVGRKFLMAGKGGLNLTHAEKFEAFLARYANRRAELEPLLKNFSAEQLRAWANELGIETFVGSSGRVFPKDMKAAPLLRAWLQRLRKSGVHFYMRHRWLGWSNDDDNTLLRFATPKGEQLIKADAVILALGGGSWARLGSTGAWVNLLQQRGVTIEALKPANCGFNVAWSKTFAYRFAGQAVKSVQLTCNHFYQRGEFIITSTGVEGSLIYAASALLRDDYLTHGVALIHLDLMPDKSLTAIQQQLAKPRGKDSFSNYLRKRLNLMGVKAGLLREVLTSETLQNTEQLAHTIKALPITLLAPRPLDEAISTAGGIYFSELNEHLMLQKVSGVFCAGEMLDWEAPTGGYLLTACFASGRTAAQGVLTWLKP